MRAAQSGVAAALLSLAVTGCVTGPAVRPASGGEVVSAWRLGPEDLRTQSLFRGRYEGPGRDGGFRLTLRLEAADRYELSASDLLGRRLWTVQTEGDGWLVLDHRKRRYCRYQESTDLPESELEGVALEGLARLLVGRVPIEPETVRRLSAGGWEIVDLRGRRWSGRSVAGSVERWTLWEGNEPRLWCERKDGGWILSGRSGFQFRWRRTVREPLAAPVEVPDVPTDYLPGGCESGWFPAPALPRTGSG